MEDIIDRLNMLAYMEESGTYSTHRDKMANATFISPIEISFRETMSFWAFQVIDHYSLDREIVSIAFANYDRIMAIDTKKSSKSSWSIRQLILATSLNLAIKMHEGRHIGMEKFVEFSHGKFSVSEMENVEKQILVQLGWRIHPPTPLSFSLEILRLYVFPYLSEISGQSGSTTAQALEQVITDATSFFTEIVVGDYEASLKRPSSIALACVTNVIEDMIGKSHSNVTSLSEGVCVKVDKNTDIAVCYDEVLYFKSILRTKTDTGDECAPKPPSFVLSGSGCVYNGRQPLRQVTDVNQNVQYSPICVFSNNRDHCQQI